MVKEVSPEFIFLNETHTFQFEAEQALDVFRGEYCHVLNSDDVHDPELPFIKNRSKGGTMILWKRALNQYVSVLTTETPSFIAILFHPSTSKPTIHISLYLPTSGKEAEFVEEITKLRIFIDNLLDSHPDHLIYIRGDSNVNPNNGVRVSIFNDFKKNLKLTSVPMRHKTYHHFLGEGLFDSEIDVILHNGENSSAEVLQNIFCKSECPWIESHHDAIVSSFNLPKKATEIHPTHCQAPTVPNVRKKVNWSDESLDDYKELLGDNLANLRKRWLQPSSKTCVSVLLQTTSEILCLAAESTNSTINLSERKPAKSVKVPAVITRSLKRIKLTWRSLKRCSLTGSDAKIIAASENHTNAKAKLRSLTRSFTGKQRYAEDQKMFALLSSTSSSGTIFRKIKALKKSSVEEIPFLKVGSKTFHGDEVKNGFYESIANLKAKTNKVDDFNFIDDYNNILDICKNKKDLPRISLDESTKILKKMKQSVSDFFSITPAHYINGGEAGMEHFNFLLNCIIDDVNNATIEELNVCYAL